jgi:hypothetical protein
LPASSIHRDRGVSLFRGRPRPLFFIAIGIIFRHPCPRRQPTEDRCRIHARPAHHGRTPRFRRIEHKTRRRGRACGQMPGQARSAWPEALWSSRRRRRTTVIVVDLDHPTRVPTGLSKVVWSGWGRPMEPSSHRSSAAHLDRVMSGQTWPAPACPHHLSAAHLPTGPARVTTPPPTGMRRHRSGDAGCACSFSSLLDVWRRPRRAKRGRVQAGQLSADGVDVSTESKQIGSNPRVGIYADRTDERIPDNRKA